jgi:multiple sugar transport system permease protein
MVKSPRFHLRNFSTLLYVVLSVALQCVLGFWLAYLLTKDFKSRGLVRSLTLIPWAVAGLMVGIIWNLMMGQTYGVVNDLLMKLHIVDTKISWFSTRAYALTAIVIANVWRGIPFFTISFMSALSGIPEELYESGKMDGARPLTTLFKITIPIIKDTIIITTLLRALWTFNAVDLIISLTDGGPNRGTTTLALYIMRTFSNDFNYGYASALSTISTIIMLVFAFIYIKFGKLGKGGIV